MITDLILFLLGSAGHIGVKYLDVLSSRAFSKEGIKESNPLFRDKNKNFSEWRAWVGFGIIQAIATFLFVFGPASDPSGTMHPLHSLIVFVLSGLMSAICYFTNLKDLKNRKARTQQNLN